jgi:hypothetical protein
VREERGNLKQTANLNEDLKKECVMEKGLKGVGSLVEAVNTNEKPTQAENWVLRGKEWGVQ